MKTIYTLLCLAAISAVGAGIFALTYNPDAIQMRPPEEDVQYSVEISVDGKVAIQHIPVTEVLHIVMDDRHTVGAIYTIDTKDLK